MKETEYTVIFTTGGEVTVWAFCSEDAIILAQAERIKSGKSKDVLKVERKG